MKKEKFSNGSAILIHTLFIFFLIPIFLFCLNILIRMLWRDFSIIVLMYLVFFGGIFFVTTMNALTRTDVYLEGETIILKKLWGIQKRHVSKCKRIGSTIISSVFYLEFEDGRKDYFKSKELESSKHSIGTDHDRLLKEFLIR